MLIDLLCVDRLVCMFVGGKKDFFCVLAVVRVELLWVTSYNETNKI